LEGKHIYMAFTLISTGDFIDLWFEVRRRGWLRVMKHFHPDPSSRVINTFSCIDPGAVDWWTIPAVRERWNLMITGNAKVEYQQYVCDKYFKGKTGLQLLSVGCGGGTPEINFAKQACFSSVKGFDISEKIVRHASAKIPGTGLNNISFFRADAEHFDYGKEKYDVILFHSSLHHLKDLGKIALKIKAALKPGGIILVHEYAGPNRNQWKKDQLRVINDLLKTIPAAYRKRVGENKLKDKVYRPGLLRMWLNDPSEAVQSENLAGILQSHFLVLEQKTFGGNILHPLLKDIGHHFQDDDEKTTVLLQKLFHAEDDFLAAGNPGDFIFGVYQNKTA
jgi:ubiquinone/menaquinone biosynthesis C-methylase UbiE